MLEAISVPALLAHPRAFPGCYVWTRTWWSRPEVVALKALCDGRASLEKSADSLGRTPTSIAHYARDTGLTLPVEWRDAIIKRKPSKVRLADPQLQYPYIRQVRGEHADLLQVNSLVPRGLPDHVRADVCQEIMLALWMKKITLEELRADSRAVRSFIKGFRATNHEAGGFALSLDAPMHDGRSWYDVLPDDAGFHH
jgi:hypothetical protein